MRDLTGNDVGIIGNSYSSAIVSRYGSIDWCSLPYLDSPSHFNSLLNQSKGGRFQIVPQGEFRSRQRYLPGAPIIETLFETPTGTGTLTDWMPSENQDLRQTSSICRKIEVLEGSIQWTAICTPKFKYGTESAQAERHRKGVILRGKQQDDLALLQSDIPLSITEDGSSLTRFEVHAGQSVRFKWSWGRQSLSSSLEWPYDSTLSFWNQSGHKCPSSGCVFAGPWHDRVVRSGIILKLLSSPYLGTISDAIVSSSGDLNSETRQWRPRHASIRNSTLAFQALLHLGYVQEAKALFNWISEIIIRDGAAGLQSIYLLDGGTQLLENDRVQHFQLDIYGHAMTLAFEYYNTFGELPDPTWKSLVDITETICQVWKRPDFGPFGNAHRAEHFVVSKVFCWAALDRACRLSELLKQPIPHRWVNEREIIHKLICSQGFDDRQNSFIRSFGESELDVSTLWIPLLRFLPNDDLRVRGTIDRIQSELSAGVFLRLKRDSAEGPESIDWWGTLLLVACLSQTGRVDEASDRLAEICTYTGSIGLLGDQPPANAEPLSLEFPSSSLQIGLIYSALQLGLARKEQRAHKFSRKLAS